MCCVMKGSGLGSMCAAVSLNDPLQPKKSSFPTELEVSKALLVAGPQRA